VTLRIAVTADAAALDALAGRETRPLPAGPFAIAVREGRIIVAISLSTGDVLADPFVRTAELCDVVRCYACGVRVKPDRDTGTVTPFNARVAVA
jgi:hypothetical protein